MGTNLVRDDLLAQAKKDQAEYDEILSVEGYIICSQADTIRQLIQVIDETRAHLFALVEAGHAIVQDTSYAYHHADIRRDLDLRKHIGDNASQAVDAANDFHIKMLNSFYKKEKNDLEIKKSTPEVKASTRNGEDLFEFMGHINRMQSKVWGGR